jgi:hypothetical protein
MLVLNRWAAWPPRTRWLGGIAAAVLALVIVWALFVPLTDWLAHHDVGPATGTLHETAVDNARGRLLTLAAGLLAAGALVFTALNFRLLRRNSEQADQWQRRTHELTEQGQVTDRYAKAVEQLGSDKLDVRVGGVYALERIARDSARDHPTVMEVLSAFIREHSSEQWPPPEPGSAQPGRLTRPDIQAAATVIGRRDKKHDTQSIDLGRADLAGADLTRADLGAAKLRYANLSGANLGGAHLVGAQLHSANLRGAYLAGADFRGAYLTWAELAGANLDSANFTEADLREADLNSPLHARPNFTEADLTRARWSEYAPVPEGWELDAGSGRLRRAGGGH